MFLLSDRLVCLLCSDLLLDHKMLLPEGFFSFGGAEDIFKTFFSLLIDASGLQNYFEHHLI